MRIGQQMYTRERRGLYRGSEGYDSIAKSPGLTDAFIKESVHCYCAYSPSRRLQSEDAPPEAYPAAYTFARYPDGRALLGRAVYVAADFTGQRSTFFAHNFILPEDFKLDIGTLERTVFLSEYDISCGNELPELDELPVKAEPPEKVSPVCAKAFFSSLVSRIIQSLAGAKKIYVQAPVSPEETSSYALGILEALFKLLPPALTRGLGFLTYSREPENKKGINITFLENGTLRRGDPRVARDFFIDASIEADEEESVFADFLWDEAQNGGDLNPFYDFASAFKEEMSALHWDRITEIYLTAREYAKPEEDGAFGTAAGAFLSRAKEKPEDAVYLARLARQTQTEFFAYYINFLLENEEEDFLPQYAEEIFSAQNRTEDLFAEASFWHKNIPAAFKSEMFLNVIKRGAARLLDKSSEPIATAAKLYAGAIGLPLFLNGTIDAHLMPRIDFVNITRGQLAELPKEFILYGVENGAAAGRTPLPYLLLEILKKISLSLDSEKVIGIRDFIGSYDLPANEKKYLVIKLREMYVSFISRPHFGNISLLFKNRAELLEYVNGNASAETKADFLVWAVDAEQINQGDPREWEAVKSFVKANIKDGAFKERIHRHPVLKALSRELRFGKLAGLMS